MGRQVPLRRAGGRRGARGRPARVPRREGRDGIWRRRTHRATARRELREEVSIDVGAVEYVHSRSFETDTGAACVNIVTLCENEDGKARVRSPEEVAAVHWLTPEEIMESRSGSRIPRAGRRAARDASTPARVARPRVTSPVRCSGTASRTLRTRRFVSTSDGVSTKRAAGGKDRN